MNIYLLMLLVGIVMSPISAYAQTSNIFSTKETIEASVKTVPCNKDERLDAVKRLFEKAGAKNDEIVVEKFDKDKITNVVVRKKGKTDETIVVGAHFDKTPDGCGVMDNWTGVVIITHLYQSVRELPTNKSYVFVAFDQEEKGLKGSGQMVKAMSKPAIEQICSMVNFDSFGQALPMALRNASSPKMIKLAVRLGEENDFKFIDVEIPGASSDSASFRDKKIPSITLSGLGRDWQDVLHSSNDKIERVNMDSVFLGYRFGLLYLTKLDATACGEYK